jgi:hypothetical protein
MTFLEFVGAVFLGSVAVIFVLGIVVGVHAMKERDK